MTDVTAAEEEDQVTVQSQVTKKVKIKGAIHGENQHGDTSGKYDYSSTQYCPSQNNNNSPTEQNAFRYSIEQRKMTTNQSELMIYDDCQLSAESPQKIMIKPEKLDIDLRKVIDNQTDMKQSTQKIRKVREFSG